MSKVVNLKQARKSRARDEARRQGDANAAKFGRRKAEIMVEKGRGRPRRAGAGRAPA